MTAPSQLQVLANEAPSPRPYRPFPRRRRRPRSTREIAIRFARRRDASAIHDLEALDSRVLPEGPQLVAEADGIVVAAISVGDGTVVADPFECTINAVALLRLRARQLRRAGDAPAAPRLTLIERLAR